jgi:predicted O-linked N-acetylglucosamine transferase (SPINDLY family)
MALLRRHPHAKLWLLRFPGRAEPALLAEAKAAGILEGRLVITDLFPLEEHLEVGY